MVILSSYLPIYLMKVVLLYALVFCVILPCLLNDAVYSVYFRKSFYEDNALRIAKEKNFKRLEDAKQYFQAIDPDKSKFYHKERLKCNNLKLLILVITVKRETNTELLKNTDELGYLTQVMAKLDIEINSDSRECDVALIMCNAHQPAKEHIEAKYLNRYFVNTEKPQKEKYYSSGRFKEQQDKIFCFKESMNYKYDYLLMVEDDAIPVNGFIDTLKHILRYKVEMRTLQGQFKNFTSKWAYLNLHFPERWQGFSRNIKHVLELTGIGILGAALFLSIFKANNCIVRVFSMIFGASFFILLVLSIGRQYFLNLFSLNPDLYRLIPAPGCCTPATLYPSIQLPKIIDYLTQITCNESYGFDLALSDFSDKHTLKRYLVSPNIFHHIGLFSTLTVTKDASYYL